ncbi:hypothetical protein [Levilactobacillus bambusae]|uniref:Uncharacterized protein n=1 Tax=Levilactobacillus bambusae TaxID=2024736 RepID=A0A2V1MZC6_9LACO|nr:hypothetical protein [Levilactobacillus bambusae]PWF99837.1 hypothetical protein DCM90_07190 [Levilactobacillus bambusae]
MKLTVQTFLDEINADQFKKQTKSLSLATFLDDPVAGMNSLYTFVRDEVLEGHLAQGELKIEGTEGSFRVETNVINLPMAEPNVISKITVGEEERELMIYIMVQDPKINVSSFRIDEVCSADAYVDDFDSAKVKMDDWLLSQVEILKNAPDNVEESEPESKPAPAKKPAKKTTKRTTKKTASKTTKK